VWTCLLLFIMLVTWLGKGLEQPGIGLRRTERILQDLIWYRKDFEHGWKTFHARVGFSCAHVHSKRNIAAVFHIITSKPVNTTSTFMLNSLYNRGFTAHAKSYVFVTGS
jgi:hypothetical protein